MPAYLIAEHIVTDEAKFHEFRTKVEPLMAKHGGRYLTKGSTHKLPEGGHWKPERVIIVEFPNMESLYAWRSNDGDSKDDDSNHSDDDSRTNEQRLEPRCRLRLRRQRLTSQQL